MKIANTICVIAFFVLFISTNIFSQTTGDYRTAASGNWNSTATWQVYNGSSWGGASTPPDGSHDITIQGTDSVDVNVPVTITATILNQGGKLYNSASTLTFGNNGIYNHALNGGSVPLATWETGSTCLVTGVTGNVPSNCSQNFYNITFNCSNFGTTNLNMGWNNVTIKGNFIMYGSPTKTQLRMTASGVGNLLPGPNVITINGNIELADTLAYFTPTGSSSGDTIEVRVKGNINSQGTLNLANGSAAQCNWYVEGDLNITDGVMTTNSSAGALADTFFFSGTAEQKFYKADSVGSAANIQFIVLPGAIVNMGLTSTGGSNSATFTQKSSSTLISAHKIGLKGNLSTTGLINLSSEGGSYEYNGIVSQQDSLLPASVVDLTIDNPDTVSLTQPTTVNGVLTLKQGILDNSVHAITIAAGGSVVFAGGSTTVPIPGWPVSVKEVSVVPREFKLYNNYPNPFNPSTIIRFSVPKDGYTSLKVMNILGQEITTLFEGYAKAGNLLEASFSGKNISSGVYFAKLQQGEKVSIKKMNLIK